MIFQNSTQAYPKSMANVRVRQQVRRQKVVEFPGGILLWKAMGKVSAALVLVVFALQLVLGSMAGSNVSLLKEAELERHTLVDANIMLRAQKAQLLSEAQIELAAKEKLALVVPGKGQRYTFNR